MYDLEQSAGRERLRSIAGRRPIAVMLTILFGLAYPVAAVGLLAVHGVLPGGGLPEMAGIDDEEAVSLLMIWFGILPATVIATYAADGRGGLRRLGSRMIRWRIAGWWVVVVAVLPALTILFAVLLGDSIRVDGSASVLVNQAAILLLVVALVNLWEETAWGGFVQTRLERRYPMWLAALLTAAPFAAMHVPLAFIGEFTAASIAGAAAGYFVLGFIIRLLAGLVLRGARDSILAIAFLHASFNRSNNDGGIAAQLVDGPNRQLGALLAALVVLVVLAATLRRRLGRAYRIDVLDRISAREDRPADLRSASNPIC